MPQIPASSEQGPTGVRNGAFLIRPRGLIDPSLLALPRVRGLGEPQRPHRKRLVRSAPLTEYLPLPGCALFYRKVLSCQILTNAAIFSDFYLHENKRWVDGCLVHPPARTPPQAHEPRANRHSLVGGKREDLRNGEARRLTTKGITITSPLCITVSAEPNDVRQEQ